MSSTLSSRWAPRGASFVLWALLAASAAFWALKFSARAASTSSVTAVSGAPTQGDPAATARLLGAGAVAATAAPAAVNVYARFVLVGVVAGASRGGAALIAADGKAAKPYRVGSKVDEGLVLQSVAPRRAMLAASTDGPVLATLEMAAPRQAQGATGLPGRGLAGAAGFPPVSPPAPLAITPPGAPGFAPPNQPGNK